MIDLGSPRPTPVDLLDALPRRVSLTLPELRLVAERAGGAPLPFDVTHPTLDPLTARLGRTRDAGEAAAYVAALEDLHDPASSLGRRGLLTAPRETARGARGAPGVLDAGLLGAVGLLATPTLAVDVDVAVGGVHARSWHRQSGAAVATLSTVDGIVFELAWFATPAWPDELSRVAVLPEDVALTDSAVPEHLVAPFELVDAMGEAVRTSRSDLVAVLVERHSGRTTDGSGRALADADAATALSALGTEGRGRLRVLVAEVSAHGTEVVGVVSWTLLQDGWRALLPRQVDTELHVEVRRVAPSDLAGDLAPVLAEVRRREAR